MNKALVGVLAALAIGAAAWFIYDSGFDAGHDAASLAYEKQIKEERAQHENDVRAVQAAADRSEAERRAKADAELVELRRRVARDDAALDRMRDELDAYRRRPVSDAAACTRDRDRLAGLAVRGAELLRRADSALEWCRIELEAAGARPIDKAE